MFWFSRDHSIHPYQRDSIQPEQLLLYLDDHVEDGSAAGKLHGLILCVRRHYEGDGFKKEAIADRSLVSEERVTQVLQGNFFGPPGWVMCDVIVDMLLALDATPAELEVAVQLHDQMAREHKAEAHANWPTRRPARSPALAPPLRLDAVSRPAQSATPAPPGPASAPEPESPPAQPAPRRQAGKTGEEDRADPMAAKDIEEFVAVMKFFRAAKGNKSFRRMERKCTRMNSELVSRGLEPIEGRTHSTFSTIGNNGKLPSLETVRAYIVGAGGDLEELATWEQAWARLAPRFASD